VPAASGSRLGGRPRRCRVASLSASQICWPMSHTRGFGHQRSERAAPGAQIHQPGIGARDLNQANVRAQHGAFGVWASVCTGPHATKPAPLPFRTPPALLPGGIALAARAALVRRMATQAARRSPSCTRREPAGTWVVDDCLAPTVPDAGHVSLAIGPGGCQHPVARAMEPSNAPARAGHGAAPTFDRAYGRTSCGGGDAGSNRDRSAQPPR
jgi:hypothetical protein